MTNEEAIRWLDAIKKYYIHGGDEAYDKKRMKAIDMAIKALETQPCEDCISRQAVKNGMIKYGFHAPDMTVTEFVEDCLPSITPKYTDEEIDKIQAMEQAYVDKMVELAVKETERPKGKWIDDCGGVKCSCYGYSIDDDHYAKAYCTNCGAEMSGGGEE